MQEKLNYTFKAILDNKEAQAKVNKGAYYIEIQLLKDFLEENYDIQKNFDNYIKTNIDVRTVHAPLAYDSLDNGCLYLESLTNEKYYTYFFNVCKLGQMFADYYKHEIKIIIHNSFRLDNFLLCPALLTNLINMMNSVIDLYPDLIIEIENTTPLNFADNQPYFSAGMLDENVDIVNYLNKHCKKPIFRTVFDICHYLITIRMLKILTNKDYFLEDLFKKHEKVIGTLHFANLRNLGLNEGEHGCGYINTKEDIELLKEILYLVEKYAYNADFCLEISEDDYLNIPDVLETINLITLIKEGKL